MKDSVLLLIILICVVSAVLLGLFIVSKERRRASNEKKRAGFSKGQFHGQRPLPESFSSNEKTLEELRNEMFQIFTDVKEGLKSGTISRKSTKFSSANKKYKKLFKIYYSMGGEVR